MSEVAQVSPMPEGIVATPEVVTPEPAKEIDSAKWAAIAKKEQRLVHEQQALRKEREELSLLQKEYKERQELRQKDKIAYLKAEGFTETEIFNWLAENQPKESTPEEKATKAAQDEIAKFRKEENEKAQALQQAQEQQVLTRFKGRLHSFLETNKDKYEACADYGEVAEDAAYRLIEQIAKDTGEVVNAEEAYQALEDFYAGEYERMSKYQKYQKKEETVDAPLTPEVSPKPVPRGTKTLTNAATQTVASSAPKSETREQKRERLINQIKQTGLRK